MAKVKKNLLTKGLSGSIGEGITFAQANGETRAANKIGEQQTATEAMRRHRELFAQAVEWAQSQPGNFNANIQFYFQNTLGQGTFDQAVFI